MALFGPRVVRDPLSAEARALIDAAVAAGRITRIPTGVSGLPVKRLPMKAADCKASHMRIARRKLRFERAARKRETREALDEET